MFKHLKENWLLYLLVAILYLILIVQYFQAKKTKSVVPIPPPSPKKSGEESESV